VSSGAGSGQPVVDPLFPSEAPASRPTPVVCDVSGIIEPDGPALEALVRLALTARRMGTSIALRNACPRLVDLIAIAGLDDVLVNAEIAEDDRSGVEVDGQVEEGEQ
jgi:anti-anti-sigma regulatory factor